MLGTATTVIGTLVGSLVGVAPGSAALGIKLKNGLSKVAGRLSE
jgi:hypothetical protein